VEYAKLNTRFDYNVTCPKLFLPIYSNTIIRYTVKDLTIPNRDMKRIYSISYTQINTAKSLSSNGLLFVPDNEHETISPIVQLDKVQKCSRGELNLLWLLIVACTVCLVITVYDCFKKEKAVELQAIVIEDEDGTSSKPIYYEQPQQTTGTVITLHTTTSDNNSTVPVTGAHNIYRSV